MTRDELEAIRARLAEKDAIIARLKRAVDSDDGMDSFCDDLLEQFGPMQVQLEKAERERDALREAAQRFFDEYDGGSVDGVATALADLRRLLEVLPGR